MTPRATGTQLAEFAGLLADPTRAAICLALLDGRAWTAGELARHVSVAPSTATEHLDRLVAGGLLAQRKQGRHRYVELASTRVAELLEDLSGHLAPLAVPAGSLRTVTASAALARGRTCYDHLAGRLGVAVTEAMTRAGLIQHTTGFALTEDGVGWLITSLGVDPDALRRSRRPLARACLDWTERRPHLGGLAGARLCEAFFARRWIARVGTGRAVRVTPSGAVALRDLLDLPPEAYASGSTRAGPGIDG